MSDDHIAITGLALCAIWVAATYARRYFRTLPDYCVTPLGPEVRPGSAGFAAAADQALAVAANCDDPVAVQWDALHEEGLLMALEVMATIDALCDPEVAE